MKKLMILAVTFDLNDPCDVSQWSVTGMRDMQNQQHGPWNGQLALDFMKQADIVMLWHWPPPEMVEILHAHGISVIAPTSITDVATYPVWNPVNEALRSALVMLPLRRRAETLNRFDQPFHDAYEADPAPWDEKPHVWAIEADSQLCVNAVRDFLTKQLAKHGAGQYPDGIFIDTHLAQAYFGTASNAPAERPLILWDKMDQMISGLFAPTWGHDAIDTFSCFNVIMEHALRDKTVTELAVMVAEVQAQGRTITLAPNNGKPGADKLDTLASWNIFPDYVQVARSGSYALDDVDLLGQ